MLFTVVFELQKIMLMTVTVELKPRIRGFSLLLTNENIMYVHNVNWV